MSRECGGVHLTVLGTVTHNALMSAKERGYMHVTDAEENKFNIIKKTANEF